MKKSELKELLKPLIKECIKESILEDGILSNIITEVTKGLSTSPILEQRKRSAPPVSVAPTDVPNTVKVEKQQARTVNQRLAEHKRKLMSVIGHDSYGGIDLFEGTTPAPGQSSQAQMANPMNGTDPRDAGIDISGLMAATNNKWKDLI